MGANCWKSDSHHRRSTHVYTFMLVMMIMVSLPLNALSQQTVSKTNMSNGFGNPENEFAWSMAWFNGNLYVGTARHEFCFERATLAFHNLLPYRTDPAPGVTCPANWMDLDERAEIWRFTPQSSTWTRVYQSPTVPNPEYLGKQIAVDIGYRGMIVFQGQLYVLGVSADEVIPALQTISPPRILRTGDGVTYTPSTSLHIRLPIPI